MRNCEQTKGQSVLQHGESVRDYLFDLINHLRSDTPLKYSWRLPDWIFENKDLILSSLPGDETLELYTKFHDCGKPFCLTIDDDGRRHFPNHAQVSHDIFKQVFDNLVAAELILHDMLIHLTKSDDVEDWTTDMGNFFPDSLEPNINNWIADYEAKTSIEIGVVTVESLEGEPIEYFADDIYKRIGIGKKGADNGILIIFSKKDRKSRIQTGYGMDQFLNTTKCNRILTNIIRPNFKKEKYYEGMMAALLAIESELGDEAFSKKTEWLKEKTEKEQREHAKSVQAFWDFLLSALILSAILSPFIFIVYKRYKSRKVLEAIDKSIKSLKLIESKIPRKESINSNTLSEMIVSLNNLYTKINSSMKKENNITNEEHLEILKNYEELLNSNISKYESKKSYVLKSTQDIKSWEYISSKAKQDLENAIKAYDIVKSYGYDTTKPLSVEQIENVKHLGKQSFDLISSDIDKAINNFDNFRIQVQSIVSSGHKSISLFNSIKTAEYDISKHDQLIKSALDDMYKFKKWAKYSEESDIISKVKTYKPTTVKSDILSNHSLLKDILNTIEEIKRKWKRRKEDEEAAIRRAIEEKEAEERRRSYDDSSSSSSSSSSSFSGFGGGDSGSSGSSSDW